MTATSQIRPSLVGVTVAGVVGGVVGFYLGLIVLLSLTGLGHAQWAPPANLSGVGLVAASATGFVGGLGAVRSLILAVAAAVTGAVTGFALAVIDVDFEVVVGAGALLVIGLIALVDRADLSST